MRPLKVVHVLNELRPSGMERMLASSAPYWLEAGVETAVVGIGQEHPYASDVEAAGFTVHLIESYGILARSRDLVRILRTVRPDIVHLHSEGHYLPSTVLARVFVPRARLIRTIHSLFDARGWWLFKRRVRAAIADRLVKVLVAPSEDVASNEQRIGRATIVVQNWVADRFADIPAARAQDENERRPRALIIGNCSFIKNHDFVYPMFAKLGVALHHVGAEDGATEHERAALQELQNHGLLISRGPRDPVEALIDSDLYLMPSRHEGMGVSLAEATVAGLPAVVADRPGLGWAKGLPGIQHVPLEETAWRDAISAALSGPRTIDRSDLIDLSAERGVRAYLKLYRESLNP